MVILLIAMCVYSLKEALGTMASSTFIQSVNQLINKRGIHMRYYSF